MFSLLTDFKAENDYARYNYNFSIFFLGFVGSAKVVAGNVPSRCWKYHRLYDVDNGPATGRVAIHWLCHSLHFSWFIAISVEWFHVILCFVLGWRLISFESRKNVLNVECGRKTRDADRNLIFSLTQIRHFDCDRFWLIWIPNSTLGFILRGIPCSID